MNTVKGGRLTVCALVVVLVLGVVGTTWYLWRGASETPGPVAQPGDQQPQDDDDFSAADPEYVVVGGVRRKASDIRPPKRTESATEADADPMENYGTTPAIPANANPQVASVVEALRDGLHPERLSPVIQPKPFDPVAFSEDPEAYLATVEPGRVFLTAQPGPGVKTLRRRGDRYLPVRQGESVTLQVQAAPDAPVTFTSFDLGEFSNRLTSITVQADQQGIARADFHATTGTIANVNILAGSPRLTGQVHFVVDVGLPAAQPAAGSTAATGVGSE